MKEPSPISIDDAMAQTSNFDAIIDVRSPLEFALDHAPGAINLPVLDNDERVIVGTTNAQVSAFDAKRQGAAMVARNIGNIIAGPLADKPADWRPLVYCWRGGNRSASLATVLARVGWQTHVLDGGYRAYRRWVIAQINKLAPAQSFHVVAGRTGSGKSRILQRLAARGAQVLDLEALANHRGSVLGLMPDDVQPSQKRFESLLANALGGFDPAQPVFVESESRKIGKVQIPDALILAMRGATCSVIELPTVLRARFLTQDYPHFLRQPASLVTQLDRLRVLHGNDRIDTWREMAAQADWEALVAALLTEHYDPAYDKSMGKNYVLLDQARVLSAHDADADVQLVFDRLADQLLTG